MKRESINGFRGNKRIEKRSSLNEENNCISRKKGEKRDFSSWAGCVI